MVNANEEIDFSLWQPAEQQQALDELVAILGTPVADYSTMSDNELSGELRKMFAEVQVRPGATNAIIDSTLFNGDTLLMPRA